MADKEYFLEHINIVMMLLKLGKKKSFKLSHYLSFKVIEYDGDIVKREFYMNQLKKIFKCYEICYGIEPF